MSEPTERLPAPVGPAAGAPTSPPPPVPTSYGPVDRHGRPRVELRDITARSTGGAATLPPGARAGAAAQHASFPVLPPAPPGHHPAGPGGDAWYAVPPPPRPWTSGPPPWEGGLGAGPRRQDYASWGRRVVGLLIDGAPAWVASIVLLAAYGPTYLGFFRGDLSVPPRYALVVIGTVLNLGALAFVVYNRYFLSGRTGQTVGRRVMRTWLVSRTTGRPVGALNAFVRDLLHVLDRMGHVGYLWPLWDDEHQTLADKIAETVVVRSPVAPLVAFERPST